MLPEGTGPGQLSTWIVAPEGLDPCRGLGDAELIARLKRLASIEKGVSALVVAHLAEFDARKLYANEGFSSLFGYCTRELGLSEQAAYKRIAAARAARRFPDILQRLTDGRIHLSAVAILAPHLTEVNWRDLLDRASRRTAREIEALAAAIAPQPDRRDVVRSLPAPPLSPLPSPSAGAVGDAPVPSQEWRLDLTRAEPAPRQSVEALGPNRVHFGFTGSEDLRRKLDRVRGLMWHVDPAGRLERIVERLADFYLSRMDPGRRKARRGAVKTREEGGDSRRVPQRVKDAVWARDGGRCAFVAPGGGRCAETAGLEFDHVRPWALGGRSDSPDNVRLLCRTHNQWAARKLGLPAKVRRT